MEVLLIFALVVSIIVGHESKKIEKAQIKNRCDVYYKQTDPKWLECTQNERTIRELEKSNNMKLWNNFNNK